MKASPLLHTWSMNLGYAKRLGAWGAWKAGTTG